MTAVLLGRATSGDASARQELLSLHRQRLRDMIARRLDRRLAARVDASDIVQEALIDAGRKLDNYLRDQPLPFYPWLHRIATERLAQTHRRHLGPTRDAGRERARVVGLSEESAIQLVDRLIDRGSSPSGQLIREETNERMLTELDGLPPKDREILVMRYLDGLPLTEIAAILDLSQGAVKMRHLRALERIRLRLQSQDHANGEG